MHVKLSSRGSRRACAAAALLLCGLVALPAGAAKYAGEFMVHGGGARALALGGAFAAVADDPSTVFWNPAGLTGIDRRQVLLMHAERFGDLIDRDFGAYVQPVGWSLLGGAEGGFGVSFIRLGLDDIPLTAHLSDQLDHDGDGHVSGAEMLGQTGGPSLFDLQDQIRYASDQELAVFVSYGERRGDWSLGGSLKIVRQDIDEWSSFGIGFDFGVLRPRIWRNLDFGVKFQDLTTTYLSWSTGTDEVIAPAVIPGLAWRQPLPSWNADLLLAGSLETRFENRRDSDQYWLGSTSANLHLGAELGFSGKVFLRGGLDSGWNSGNVTAGVGFVVAPLTVDYAYAGDTLDIDELTHRVSITAAF
jgi:hypothetical protein